MKSEMIDNYFSNVDAAFPQYAEYTFKNKVIIKEMLSESYEDYASDKKRLRCVKDYLKDIMTNSFINNGVKGYLKSVIDFFFEPEIKSFVKNNLKSEYDAYSSVIDALKSHIISWQGFEGNERKKLE